MTVNIHSPTSLLTRYIVTNVPVHAYSSMETVGTWFKGSFILSKLYVNVLYPMSAVSFCASIYMTLVREGLKKTKKSVEFSTPTVCRRCQWRGTSQCVDHTSTGRASPSSQQVSDLFKLQDHLSDDVQRKETPRLHRARDLHLIRSQHSKSKDNLGSLRLWHLCVKFMEVKLTEENGTNVVDPSETRSNPTYIFYYTLSLIWHPTLTTGTHSIPDFFPNWHKQYFL